MLHVLLVALLAGLGCVYGAQQQSGCPYSQRSGSMIGADHTPNHHARAVQADAAAAIDYNAVEADLSHLLTDSKDFWPADFGNYGGLFIRLAWHCAGTYRTFDGRGGCDGARIRFSPELPWEDNANIDKALRLLEPIKLKYGPGLSWGDLIALAGTTAIGSNGGPVLGFCAGRIDDPNGHASLELGPSEEQKNLADCPVNGQCAPPLGQSKIGLVYLNAEGPMGNPIPEESAPQVRDIFGRMGMNDTESVSLIGGGHAFGKVHGACGTGPGPNPTESPFDPYPGTCGDGPTKGKGNNTFTSGFEGAWTETPTKWDNEYFKNLLKYKWEVHIGPGGRHQWRPTINLEDSSAPLPKIMMMTSDVAFIKDPIYLPMVKKYASDLDALNKDFALVWYKLMSRDMGPVTRCIGPNVPPPQPFQYPLPATPEKLANFKKVRAEIKSALTATASLQADMIDNRPYYGALFATLAWQCASTFRETDYLGGCNGARIRFSPQKDWPINKGMDKVLDALSGIKSNFDAAGKGALSWADLIVLAGQTAVEEATGTTLQFCPGRTDATEGSGSEFLEPRRFNSSILEVRDNAKVAGWTMREAVVLSARPRSPQHQTTLGYSGSYTSNPSKLSNEYFVTLLTETWEHQKSNSGKEEYKAVGKDLYMLATDIALKFDLEFKAIVQEYASDNDLFLADFGAAWTKVMNADRFSGPGKNLCT